MPDPKVATQISKPFMQIGDRIAVRITAGRGLALLFARAWAGDINAAESEPAWGR